MAETPSMMMRMMMLRQKKTAKKTTIAREPTIPFMPKAF
jgi:hypothetical protein